MKTLRSSQSWRIPLKVWINSGHINQKFLNVEQIRLTVCGRVDMNIVQAVLATFLTLCLPHRNCVLLSWNHCQNVQLDEFPLSIDTCGAIRSLGLNFLWKCSINTWKERSMLPVQHCLTQLWRWTEQSQYGF